MTDKKGDQQKLQKLEEEFKGAIRFKSILGALILVYMGYHYFWVEPFDRYLWLIPGFLLGFDPLKVLKR